MTAEEFVNTVEDQGDDLELIYHCMREFAKYHVQEALKEAKSKYLNASQGYLPDIILNSYNLKNIK